MLAPLALLSFCIAAAAHAAEPITDGERERILAHGPWPVKRSAEKPELVAFGERLFYDPRLSGTGSVLCATCHVPYRAFQDGRPRAFGLEEVDRNTPTLLNVALYRRFGWDGARDSLAAQSVRPLLEPREMRSSAAHVAAFVRTSADYAKVFGAAGASDDDVLINVGKALAAFQATLISGRTPFDDFRDALESRDEKRMARYPAPALRGLRIFIGKGACSECHGGAQFSNSTIVGGFRVPGLRNVARTAPYMHDGRVAALDEAVAHRANLGSGEREDLAAFLRTLSETSQLQ